MPKILKIVTHPNPILRKKSREVKSSELKDKKLGELLLDMEETMFKKDGAGLAAPQIGENLRIIVVRHDDETRIMINPQITKKSWKKEIEEEGCLSVIDDKGQIIYGPVSRHQKISCLYLDASGKKQRLEAEKLLARIIQHEIDHLDGILFIDRLAGSDKKKKKLPL